MTDELGDLMGLRLQTLGDDLGTSHDLLERNSPRRKVLESIQHVDELAVRSARSVSSFLHLRRERLDGISDRLYALDAMAVLKRGYAIVTREDGRVVKIADDIAIDEEMQIRLTDGKLRARRIPDKGGRNG
jgi:exodeoxyribonuclease VII large subunit